MKSNKLFVVFVVIAAVAGFFGFSMWKDQTAKQDQELSERADIQLLIKPNSPEKGTSTGRVTIVEFLDPECEACRAMHPIIKRLLSEYEGKIRFVIRYMPLHGNSKYASAALEEAREMGKFEEALDALFERQPEWADHGQPKPELIPEILVSVGVDKKRINDPGLMAKHKEKIEQDHIDGMKLGVTRTPTFFVNGQKLYEIGYEPIKKAIDSELAEAK